MTFPPTYKPSPPRCSPPLTILYTGIWEQGVYRSTGHGATWQSANTSITLPLRIRGGLAVNPVKF